MILSLKRYRLLCKHCAWRKPGIVCTVSIEEIVVVVATFPGAINVGFADRHSRSDLHSHPPPHVSFEIRRSHPNPPDRPPRFFPPAFEGFWCGRNVG